MTDENLLLWGPLPSDRHPTPCSAGSQHRPSPPVPQCLDLSARQRSLPTQNIRVAEDGRQKKADMYVDR